MATVPGDPNEGGDNVVQMLPKWAQPTMADFLQAAAIMDQKGKFKVAGTLPDAAAPIRDFRDLRDPKGGWTTGNTVFEPKVPPKADKRYKSMGRSGSYEKDMDYTPQDK